ncbi:phenylalanine--tRNA ligase subunit beta [Candidatus Woesearchaeota archaeon]|nr:phenylalanine--tRNA ligase subunit beta [Candidatus Woesearchaeota archaeon]
MPTININRRSFEKLVGKKLPDDKLRDRICYLGTDLESIDKDEIVTEIFPNRPDMLSVQGFARAFSSFIGTKPGLVRYDVKPSGEKVMIDKNLAKIRPYTACAIVKGITYDDDKIKEVIQLQEKLHITFGRNRRKAAIGIYPFEKIRTPIRFLAKKPEEIVFRPLEYPTEINARQILSKHPAGREYGHLLEGKGMFPVFIDADDNVLSVPPIINSHETGKISKTTKDVFVECSGFNFDVLKKCLNIIVTALADMGGKIYSMELVYPDKRYISPDLRPEKVAIDLDYINKRLGTTIKKGELKKLLEKMGHGYDEKSSSALVPAYRADILHQIDIAEDIAIAYGFDNFKATIPSVATVGAESKIEAFKNKLADLLAGLGLLQINTYNLTSDEHQGKLMETKTPTIKLANALSKEYNALRAWVTPSLLECFSHNKHHDYPQKIFTIGDIFKRSKSTGDDHTGIDEHVRLGVAITSDRTDYTEIRQILDYLMGKIGVAYTVIETEHDSFIKGRVGRVLAGRKKIAYIGEISPQVLQNWGLDMPVSLFELNLSELFLIMDSQ